MLEYILDFFVSWFTNPNLLGIGLAIAFGTVWLAGYWPPLFKKPWLWAVLVGSAILSLAAVSFIQIPLQVWTGQALNHFWSQEILMQWLLLELPVIVGNLTWDDCLLSSVCWSATNRSRRTN